MLAEGTLVRIRDEALDPTHEDGADCMGNQEQVETNGYLWLFVGPNRTNTPDDEPRDTLWDLKSLATGEIGVWFQHEFEIAEKEQADAT